MTFYNKVKVGISGRTHFAVLSILFGLHLLNLFGCANPLGRGLSEFAEGNYEAANLGLTSGESPVEQRGLVYKGRTVFLAGTGSFWLLNDPYYYNDTGTTNVARVEAHLDKYKPDDPDGKALGVIRVSAFGPMVRYGSVNHSKKRYPVKRVSGHGDARDGGLKFDCTEPDPAFFDHLKNVASLADERGIILGIILWDECAFEKKTNGYRWQHNPFEPENNVNNFGLPNWNNGANDGLPAFYTSDSGGLRDAQDAIVEKFCSELKGVPNVFFHIQNESTADKHNPDWRQRQIDTINNYNDNNDTNLLHVAMDYENCEIEGEPCGVPASDGVSPSSCKYGFGEEEEYGFGADNEVWRSDGRPCIAARDARDNTGGPDQYTIMSRKSLWYRFARGAACAGARDLYSGDSDPWETFSTAADEDQQLYDFVNSISSDLNELVPADSYYSGGWYGRRNKGVEYIAYKEDESKDYITVNLSGESGKWKCYDWDPANPGDPTDRGIRNGGSSVTIDVREGECGVRLVNVSFGDVPEGHWAYSAIYKLYNAGITKGCSSDPLMYCPDKEVTKAAMAVFLLRSIHGGSYTPPTATGIFTDVDVDEWYAPWVEQLYKEGITKGCNSDPLMYCPDRVVTKAAMAVFLVRTLGL